MPKLFAFAVLLSGSALAQTHAPAKPHLQQFDRLDDIRGTKCEVPEGFGCGILFDLDLPESGNMNLSVVGGVVQQISVILNGTMYTVVYDPQLRRDEKFFRLKSFVRIPARIDGDFLIIQWTDQTRARRRVVCHQKIQPQGPRPA